MLAVKLLNLKNMSTLEPTYQAISRQSTTKRAIRNYMTAVPHSIAKEQPLAVAHQLMRDHKLRHIPVLEGGKLVGIVSQRDLYFIETLRGIDPETDRVEEAMRQDVYCVRPDARIDEVVATMARQKYGSTIVVEGRQVVGIFTTTDALDLLVQHLNHAA